jgi:cytoskeletal protein CcmA (bactofilin family)
VILRGSKTDKTESTPPTRPAPTTGRSQVADSLIAAGLEVAGDCSTPGTLRVDGRIRGDVRARRLVVGPEGRVDGNVSGPDGGPAEDGVLIEGKVDGTVQAPRVEVGHAGSVGGGLRVREAIVRGRVDGSVVAEQRLVLEETAIVDGDVTTPVIGVREGGQVYGTIRIGKRPSTSTASSALSSAGATSRSGASNGDSKPDASKGSDSDRGPDAREDKGSEATKSEAAGTG